MIKHKLPKNWIVLNSKTHPDRVYYFNVKTNQSSWEQPTTDQSEKVTTKLGRPSKKRRTSIQEEDTPVIEPKTPEDDASKKRISERKKLVAKRTCQQTKGKTNEEKETPQMRAIREKILKKKEKTNIFKIQSPKNTVKLPVSKSKTVESRSESDTNEKIICTPQMQILLEKIQERNSKGTSKKKVIQESGDNNNEKKQEEPIKSRRLRSKSMYNQRNTSSSEYSSSSASRNDERGQQSLSSVITEETTKQTDDQSSVISTSKKTKKRSFKKNLGKERMETLRRSLVLETSKNESSESTSRSSETSATLNKYVEKLPSIYKHAEVRLKRLKDRLSKDKISINKSPCSDPEKTVKLSEKSLTTVDDLVKQSNDDSFYEEMDWEPMEDEKITFEIQAVRSQLCADNNTDLSCSVVNILNCSPPLEQQEKRQLYIVVDTNVFLSNIEAVDLVKETTFKTYDKPVIVIPWTVVRELDYIKGNYGKTKPAALVAKARKAISYIHKLFSSKHPRIVGQKRQDAARNKEKFAIDCPDDEILQTCLQIRDFEKSVVLLSYDINLCNKAMIYDIVTLGRNDPVEKIDYLNATNHANKSPRTGSEQDKETLSSNSVSISDQELHVSHEILDDAKSSIKEFLTVIVSKEMHALYGEPWEKYAIVKPPWTIINVLQCAIKHWIAAVSESFLRKGENVLKELLQLFRDTSGKITLKDVSYILDKCSDLIQMVNMDKHPDLMIRTLQKIDELKQRCRDLESLILDQKLRDAIGIENDVAERERRAQKAFQYFETAYTFSRDMCGLASEIVGMPCSFPYTIPNPLPTPDYVKQIQPDLAANVNRLLHTLSAAIEQVKDSCTDYRTINNLHQALITFLPESEPLSTKLANDDLAPLDVYCCVKQKEEVLKTGLRQLQELSTHFCRLASYRCI
ncbi:transcriptional protein SWT1 isoform X1 [Hylaeus volcanicus]|uniref:transcriptional protein SWT1 isoform X1 n=1 Tax=Hylaeus volcanicus TaxID=313075 RepID=UPI0023B7A632|nr:transcriptional protein SWT1 isoform X1 [Hylaeus volcanicus]